MREATRSRSTRSRIGAPLVVAGLGSSLGGCSLLFGVDDLQTGAATGGGGSSTSTSQSSHGVTSTTANSSVASTTGSAPASSSSGGVPDPYRDAVLADGPVLYLRFEETAADMLFDEVSQSAVGAYATSGVAIGAPGIQGATGTAALFTGGRALVDDTASLDFVGTAPYTLEAWIDATPNAMTMDYYGRIIAKEEFNGGANRQGYNLLYERAMGDPNGSIITERWNVTGVGANKTPFKMNEGSYHHVVSTFDGAVLRLYVDGAFVAQNSGIVPLLDLVDPVAIGSLPDTGSPFLGAIDEVAIYAKALGAPEIAKHFAIGSTAP
ncbi:MAG: LamG domain-containing protein [Polyangiaceae bacterium]